MDTNQNTGFGAGVAGAPPQGAGTGESWQEGSGQARKTMAERSREAKTQMKEGARQASQTIRRKSGEAAHQLQEKSNEFVQTRKSELAGKVSGCGAAVRRAADKLRDEEDPNIAHYADMVADRFEQAGQYLETSDLRAMYHDVENFARRRPEIVLGGMFVAGLALARFLKASNERPHDEMDQEENYWVEDYETTDVGMTGPGDMSLTGPVGPAPVAPTTPTAPYPTGGTSGSTGTPGPVI